MSTMIPRRSERNRRPTKWAIEETATERSRHDRQDSLAQTSHPKTKALKTDKTKQSSSSLVALHTPSNSSPSLPQRSPRATLASEKGQNKYKVLKPKSKTTSPGNKKQPSSLLPPILKTSDSSLSVLQDSLQTIPSNEGRNKTSESGFPPTEATTTGKQQQSSSPLATLPRPAASPSLTKSSSQTVKLNIKQPLRPTPEKASSPSIHHDESSHGLRHRSPGFASGKVTVLEPRMSTKQQSPRVRLKLRIGRSPAEQKESQETTETDNQVNRKRKQKRAEAGEDLERDKDVFSVLSATTDHSSVAFPSIPTPDITPDDDTTRQRRKSRKSLRRHGVVLSEVYRARWYALHGIRNVPPIFCQRDRCASDPCP